MENNMYAPKVFRIDDPYAFLTKELLEKEYFNNHLTDKQIAEKYNIGSKATIWRRRKFYGVSNKIPTKSNQNARKNRRFNISKEDAIKWRQEGKNYFEIADMVGCSRIVVFRRFKELGLTDDCPQAQNKIKWHENINDLQERFFLGDLLGDGSIKASGMFQCSHSYKQKQYIMYKQEILSSLISPLGNSLLPIKITNKKSGKTYNAYYLRTLQNKYLKEMHKQFYRDGTKIFPLDYLITSDFDEYSLAIWYMDDGSRSSQTATIYTYGFGYDGNLDILRFLWEKFCLRAIIKCDDRDSRSVDCRHFVTFPKEESRKFFSLVAPHILPCFQYKLPTSFQNPV